MIGLWYSILALTFIVFAMTEGRNFGVGIVLHLVGRTPAERRAAVHAVGPLWSWHEVWLIAAGLTLFMAFPKVLAAGLSGYYLAVFVVLWCGVLRGIALEFGGHTEDPLWQTFWNATFSLGSALLAILFGAAFGNLLRGVPLDEHGLMFMPLFTDFRPVGQVGILDWYTLAVALFTLALLAAHGATYLALRTTDAVSARSLVLAKRLWLAVLVMLPLISYATGRVRPDFFGGLRATPLGWICVVLAVAGLAAALAGLYMGADHLAARGSHLGIAGLLGGAAAAVYPYILRSTLDPRWSMTARDGAAGAYALKVGLVWYIPAVLLTLWTAWTISRFYRERDTAGQESA